MSSDTPVTPTSFINVLVVATPTTDPTTGKVIYTTTFSPEAIKIRERDTVINYQLISPTPDHVKIKKVTFYPELNDQLSIPSIGKSGRLATFNDKNSQAETFNVTLYFIDKDDIEFNVDPEVVNDPDPV